MRHDSVPELSGAGAGATRLHGAPRVLILTAGFGEGHNAAARGLAAGFQSVPGKPEARVVDIFSLATPRTDALIRRGYLAAINRTPKLWSAIYRLMNGPIFFPRYLWTLRAACRELGAWLDRENPVALCSTYPVYAFMLPSLMKGRAYQPPHFNIVTDSISINSLWWKAPCDGWILPNDDSAQVLLKAGIPPGRLHVLGFPVAPFFSAHENELAPPDLRTGVAPKVLHIIHSGTRGAEETARRLLADTDWEVTLAVGRDAKLRARLEALASGRRARAQVFGWTDQIPHLLMTHHVVVSKAGGATTQEAIAARCPMIVSQIVPGQEEGNYELLKRHGVGALAQSPDAVMSVLRKAFSEQGALWRTWRSALDPLARPQAAKLIAAHVMSAASAPSTLHESIPSR